MVDDSFKNRIRLPGRRGDNGNGGGGGNDPGCFDSSCVPDVDCLPDLDCLPDCDCSMFLLPSALLGLIATATPARPARDHVTVAGRAGAVAIRGYQRWLSPHLPTRCRQTPTCSEYGRQAVRRYGLVTGSRLSAARIRRCNPATPRGTIDLVP